MSSDNELAIARKICKSEYLEIFFYGKSCLKDEMKPQIYWCEYFAFEHDTKDTSHICKKFLQKFSGKKYDKNTFTNQNIS